MQGVAFGKFNYPVAGLHTEAAFAAEKPGAAVECAAAADDVAVGTLLRVAAASDWTAVEPPKGNQLALRACHAVFLAPV